MDYPGDFNFHTWVSCDEYLQATLECDPAMGPLPLNVHMNVNLKNLYGGQVRRYAAQIDAALAGGLVFTFVAEDVTPPDSSFEDLTLPCRKTATPVYC